MNQSFRDLLVFLVQQVNRTIYDKGINHAYDYSPWGY